MSKEARFYCITDRDGKFVKTASISPNWEESSYEETDNIDEALILKREASEIISDLLEESLIAEWFDIVPVRSLDKGHYKWELDKNGK